MASFLAKRNIHLGTGQREVPMEVPMDHVFEVRVSENLSLLAYYGSWVVEVTRTQLSTLLGVGHIEGYPSNHERLDSQVKRLAQFIMDEIPGEPSQDGGAIDTVIRILRTWQQERSNIFRHGDTVRIVKQGSTWEGLEGPVSYPCNGQELIGVDIGDGVVISYLPHEIELVQRFVGPSPPRPGDPPTIWERLIDD